ncbi:MAG TPA: hypothetical protein VGM89_15805 [Puia sp.]
MRKIFLLATTAILLTAPATFANGGKEKAKQKQCTHCTKQNCSGQKCADCCKHGQCTKA